MDQLITKLSELIAPAVMAAGYEFWGCEFHSHGRHGTLRVYIDSPEGVGMDDCERVSRQISAILDVEDPISSSYDLEVSSPGFDRLLFMPAHYKKFIGAKVKLRLRLPKEGRRNYTGIIQEVDEQGIQLLGDGKEQWQLLFAEIEKTNVVPDYSSMKKSGNLGTKRRGHKHE